MEGTKNQDPKTIEALMNLVALLHALVELSQDTDMLQRNASVTQTEPAAGATHKMKVWQSET